MTNYNSTTSQKATLWIFIFVLIGFSIWVLAKISSRPVPDQSNPVSISSEVLADDWVAGNKESKVILIEYGDFQCPACGIYHPLVNQLLDEHGDKFQFVFRNFPLSQHKNARPAAYASGAAGEQDKFWEMYDMIFEHQKDWSSSGDAEGIFVQYAQLLELDVDKFKQDFNSGEVKDKVDKDSKGGYSNKVNSTPTFYLNGKRVQPSGYNEFVDFIQQANG